MTTKMDFGVAKRHENIDDPSSCCLVTQKMCGAMIKQVYYCSIQWPHKSANAVVQVPDPIALGLAHRVDHNRHHHFLDNAVGPKCHRYQDCMASKRALGEE